MQHAHELAQLFDRDFLRWKAGLELLFQVVEVRLAIEHFQ